MHIYGELGWSFKFWLKFNNADEKLKMNNYLNNDKSLNEQPITTKNKKISSNFDSNNNSAVSNRYNETIINKLVIYCFMFVII